MEGPGDVPPLAVRGLELAQGGVTVLRGLDFDVRRGEVLAIVGASGSGKSTLLRALAGLLDPAAGEVLVEGRPLAAADIALRRRVGVMFQGGALWSSMSVGENLMLPLVLEGGLPRRVREQRARFRLALVGLEASFGKMPGELSGGMKKRVALARALMLDPPVVLLDEPTSGLDPPTAERIDRLILGLRRHLGTTVVLVTHAIDSVFALADRMLYLDARRKTMTALGPPAELAKRGPREVRDFLEHGA
jgi:phospholipid/cholesterol/gamma-HCH transport system ATP-binding protein